VVSGTGKAGQWLEGKVSSSSVAGGADPGSGAERLTERIFWRGTGFESTHSHRPTMTSALPGPMVETAFPIPCPRREVKVEKGVKLPSRALIRLRRLAALKGHRIPAQGVTLGIPPAKQPRVLKERRIGRLSERLLSRQTLGNGSRGAAELAELAEKIQSSSLRALRASA
jgi:hypothetical protein